MLTPLWPNHIVRVAWYHLRWHRVGAFDEAFGHGAGSGGGLGAVGRDMLNHATGSRGPGVVPGAPAGAWAATPKRPVLGRGTPAERKASRLMRKGMRISDEHVILEWYVGVVARVASPTHTHRASPWLCCCSPDHCACMLRLPASASTRTEA